MGCYPGIPRLQARMRRETAILNRNRDRAGDTVREDRAGNLETSQPVQVTQIIRSYGIEKAAQSPNMRLSLSPMDQIDDGAERGS